MFYPGKKEVALTPKHRHMHVNLREQMAPSVFSALVTQRSRLPSVPRDQTQ